MPVTTSTKAISRTLLDKETDARFWAQTGYKPGQKLDAKNDPTDRIMAKVWLDIFQKVKAEDAAGRLVVTYNHPAVDQHLGDAALATHAVDAHLEAAVHEPDPATSRQHVDAAASAASTASASTQAAATYQPATVSPIVALAAAQEVANHTGISSPTSTVHDLPPDHPAHAPEAQPALPPDMVSSPVLPPPVSPAHSGHPAPDGAPHPSQAHPTPDGAPHVYTHPDGSSVVTYSHEIHGPHGHARGPIDPWDRRRRHQEQLAIAHAMTAPTVAIAVHEAEQDRASRGAPPPASTISSRTIAQLRDQAGTMAQGAGADVVGVIATADGQWSSPTFPSSSEAADWYGAAHDRGGFAYLAYFDRHDPAWPQAVNEDVGAGSLDVQVQVDRPPARDRTVVETKTDYTAVAAVGVAAGIGLIALLAIKRKRGVV